MRKTFKIRKKNTRKRKDKGDIDRLNMTLKHEQILNKI